MYLSLRTAAAVLLPLLLHEVQSSAEADERIIGRRLRRNNNMSSSSSLSLGETDKVSISPKYSLMACVSANTGHASCEIISLTYLCSFANSSFHLQHTD